MKSVEETSSCAHEYPDERKVDRNKEKILINIGGEHYETMKMTLDRFPNTLLADVNKRMLYYNRNHKCYFFDRSRLFFDAILFFYQSNGILQCPPELPLSLFEEECRFFQLPEDVINNLRLCRGRVTAPAITNEKILHTKDETMPSLKSYVWDVTNNPETSKPALYFAYGLYTLIFISVGSICFETLPNLQENSRIQLRTPFAISEFSLNICFLLHFVCCAICTPNRSIYFRRLLTWIDLLAVIPYFLMLLVSSNSGSSLSTFRFQHVCQIFRIFRVLRLSKYSRRLRVIGLAIKSSADVYATLFLCVVISVILGGSFIYFFELDMHEESHFHTIPSGIYWSIISMTTVGYGDYYPQTVGGKMFGGCFMVFGAMTLSIPVLTIIANHVAMRKQKGNGIIE